MHSISSPENGSCDLEPATNSPVSNSNSFSTFLPSLKEPYKPRGKASMLPDDGACRVVQDRSVDILVLRNGFPAGFCFPDAGP